MHKYEIKAVYEENGNKVIEKGYVSSVKLAEGYINNTFEGVVKVYTGFYKNVTHAFYLTKIY